MRRLAKVVKLENSIRVCSNADNRHFRTASAARARASALWQPIGESMQTGSAAPVGPGAPPQVRRVVKAGSPLRESTGVATGPPHSGRPASTGYSRPILSFDSPGGPTLETFNRCTASGGYSEHAKWREASGRYECSGDYNQSYAPHCVWGAIRPKDGARRPGEAPAGLRNIRRRGSVFVPPAARWPLAELKRGSCRPRRRLRNGLTLASRPRIPAS